MNCEILFRGKRTDNNEWIESDSIKQLNGEVFLLQGRCWVSVVPETVGRFTGSTDRNGVKIFEGDVVVWDYDTPDIDSSDTTPELVRWDKDYCGFVVNDNDIYTIDANCSIIGIDAGCRIIGNMYESSKLVGGDERSK